nr:uncharacterized protein LOC112801211 isoform X2 [Arachis hypogaea]
MVMNMMRNMQNEQYKEFKASHPESTATVLRDVNGTKFNYSPKSPSVINVAGTSKGVDVSLDKPFDLVTVSQAEGGTSGGHAQGAGDKTFSSLIRNYEETLSC